MGKNFVEFHESLTPRHSIQSSSRGDDITEDGSKEHNDHCDDESSTFASYKYAKRKMLKISLLTSTCDDKISSL